MGLSFRKSIQIMPGVKVNLSKSGVSVSAGVTGLHASINSKGQVRGTASLPGTGVRYTKTKNIKDLVPGLADGEKKTGGKKSASAKTAAEKKAPVKAEAAAEPEAAEIAAPDPVETPEAAPAKPKKGELAKAILAMYAVSDRNIDWGSIKNGTADTNAYANFAYLKNRAAKVLDGDIDTYLEIIGDTNPFDEFIDCGSEFSCSSENPMKMHVDFTVNTEKVFSDYADDRALVEDYVCAVAIKSARDIFALLPVWSVSLKAVDGERELLYVSFTRDSFEELNFAKIDASDTVIKFGGRITV